MERVRRQESAESAQLLKLSHVFCRWQLGSGVDKGSNFFNIESFEQSFHAKFANFGKVMNHGGGLTSTFNRRKFIS